MRAGIRSRRPGGWGAAESTYRMRKPFLSLFVYASLRKQKITIEKEKRNKTKSRDTLNGTETALRDSQLLYFPGRPWNDSRKSNKPSAIFPRFIIICNIPNELRP